MPRIRRDRLEEQMLVWLTSDLLQSGRIEDAAKSLYARVQTKLAEQEAEARKSAINAPALRKELAEKKQEAWHLTDFIVCIEPRADQQTWTTANLYSAGVRVR